MALKKNHRFLVQLIQDMVGDPVTGIEVGVCKGESARALLRSFESLERLVLIDPWKEWPEHHSYTKSHPRTGIWTQADWDEACEHVKKRFQEPLYRSRVMIIKKTSKEAAAHLIETRWPQVDFVYIDANHHYDSVKEDIRLWLPFVRTGGLLCGDDFGSRYKGVEKAVRECFSSDRLILPGERNWGVIKSPDD